MTLDLTTISSAVEAMVAAAPWRDAAPGRELALRLLRETDSAAAAARVKESRTSWLLAGIGTGLAERWPCPVLPADWTVLATDGSSIPPDRHNPVEFHLINIGRVRLTYGTAPRASIDTRADLAHGPERTRITFADGLRQLPVDGQRLAAKRAAAELAALADLAAGVAGHRVGMQDGTLLLWPIQNEEEVVRRWALEPYLDAMERLRAAGVPLASYISAPGSNDVVNALRVIFCPHVPAEMPTVDCDRCPSRRTAEGARCFAIPPLSDRALFEHWLRPGERSALFRSASRVADDYAKHDEDFAIFFCYVHVGDEVARLEMPRWVAEDADQVDLVHAVAIDQATRGRGYPPVLQEAHEAAVIGAADRRLVQRLVEEALARAGLPPRYTGKDASKRLRGL